MRSLTILSLLFTFLTLHPIGTFSQELVEEGTLEYVFESPEGSFTKQNLIILMPNSERHRYSISSKNPIDGRWNAEDLVKITHHGRIYAPASIENLSTGATTEIPHRFDGWVSPETHAIQSIHSSKASFTVMTIIQLDDGTEWTVLSGEYYNQPSPWQIGDLVVLYASRPFPFSLEEDAVEAIHLMNLSVNRANNSLKIWKFGPYF